MAETKRLLKVFLCHASADKPAVRKLSHRLAAEGWIDPWLDEEKLSLGQHWTIIIEEALAAADIVLIFLSRNSVQKEGFVQRELSYAWELSLEKPHNVIFLIPFRLDDCEVPRYLSSRQWGDYFGDKEEGTYQTLVRSLNQRYQQKLQIETKEQEQREKAERDAAEKAALEKTEREKLEREAAEKHALKKAKREARERAKREKSKRVVFEQAALKKAELVSKENLERENLEREIIEKTALQKTEPISLKKAESKNIELKAQNFPPPNKEITQPIKAVISLPTTMAIKQKQISYDSIFVVVVMLSCILLIILLSGFGIFSIFRPTATDTPFILPTPFLSETPYTSPTAYWTETQYSTDTPFMLPTDIPTITPSVTPTLTPTLTLTPIPTPTITITPSPLPTLTETLTPSVTPSLTSTPMAPPYYAILNSTECVYVIEGYRKCVFWIPAGTKIHILADFSLYTDANDYYIEVYKGNQRIEGHIYDAAITPIPK